MFLSVIIPVYNAAPYLRRCIDSVVAQDMGDELELLLIDDGSTDLSGAICDEYSSRYGWIRTFHTANGGVGKARNYGIERVRGEYFTFIDADDFIDLGLYKKIFRLHEENPSDLYVFGYKDYPERDGGVHLLKQRYCADNEALAQLYLQMKRDYLMFPVFNKIFKSDKCASCPFLVDLHYYEDCLFSLDCLKNVKTAGVIGRAAYNYVHHQGEHLGGKYTPAEVVVKVAGELKRLSGQLPQTEALAKYTILEYYNNLFHAVDSSKGLKERLKYIKVLLNEFKKYGYVEDFKAFLGRRKVLLYFPTPYVVLMMCYLRMLILKLR